jgi:DNA-binding transcriptional LysR family regulator
MSDIRERKIRQLDPTMLLIFLALMQHRRTTVVASRMGLTQSAISQSLKRMRVLFDDPLFLRRPHGLEPSAAAHDLEPAIHNIVELLKTTLAGPDEFDPARSERIVRIASNEYELASIMPQLLARMSAQARRMRVYALPLERKDGLARLADGTVDLVLGFYWDVTDEFVTTHLYDEHYVVVARRNHPIFRRALAMDPYVRARHLLVTPDGDRRGIVDEALTALGHRRDVAATVPLFLPALATLASSDLIATLPSRLAQRYCRGFDLTCRPLPLPVRSFPVSAVYHRRNEKNPVLPWMVGVIQAFLRQEGGGAASRRKRIRTRATRATGRGLS